MSSVDDLFTPDAPAGEPPPPDRLRRVGRILAVAFPLNLFGIFCFTSVPGAILALVGWQLADEEIARVESGVIPKSELPRARRKRDFAFAQLVFAILSMAAQVVIFGSGAYDALFELLIEGVRAYWPV